MALKTKLLTMLFLGTSSVAFARPQIVDQRASASVGFGASVSIRDHRSSYDTPRGPQWDGRFSNYERPNYELLAKALNYEPTQYRKDIVMSSKHSPLRGLAIEGTRGQTYLLKVVIEFSNGEVQQVPLDTTLHAGQTLTIDLDGRSRKVHRILVYRADGQAALTMNRRHNGAFNVIGF